MELDLPWPPSVNHIWRSAKGVCYLGKNYKDFLAWSFLTVRQQLPRRFRTIVRPVRVTIDLYPPNRRRYDLDNRVKPILDALTHAHVWDDDSLVVELHVSKRSILKNGRAIIEIEEVIYE
ncbi:MAG: RusA family crossover junction endodeoxyribonuclease [Thermoguttaceae bacterium]|nr:RusA family crossover junction endodeoxyribonuclease [Thermoguttaceae bacterium]